MRVLILSSEVWQDSTNGGNVLSNIFCGTGFELAQVYCSTGQPQNELCFKYYQMTDAMVIRNFFNHKEIGRDFSIQIESKDGIPISKNKSDLKFYSFFRKYRFNIFYTIKNCIWNSSNWKNQKLKKFVLDFSPDIIFAPCYGNIFMLRLTRFVSDLTGKKIISYISDDFYTLKKVNFSLFYWINLFFVRYHLRKTFPYYSLVYTMTELQKEQCEKDFHANMKILLKAVPFDEVPLKKSVGEPIRFIYAGGLYLNRWRTLAVVADIIREINTTSIKMVLDIYTGNRISRKANLRLNDGVNCHIHSTVSQIELADIYHNSDIALHVESFDLTNRLAVRMSFSTKIVDCLASGCAVMAICDEQQAGYRYLKDNDAALCASSPSNVKKLLNEINNNMIIEYAIKAKILSEKNHNRQRIANMIIEDFKNYCKLEI